MNESGKRHNRSASPLDEEEAGRLLDANRERLHLYASLLASYSGKLRLTGPSDPEVIMDEHILDCLFSVSLLPVEGAVIDVGSGGGLPGIVWALCRPGLVVTLLDSVKKKCVALEEMSLELGLENVRVVDTRCEDHARERRESYDCAAARAVASTDVLLEYLSPLVSAGGSIICFKGPKHLEEIETIEDEWHLLGLGNFKRYKYEIASKKRYILEWKKTGNTPGEYPRKVGIAEKRRWWRC
ncbi:MAG: 16S rRNA (guanine(527)-N(7))-methyltransferase RsmG [Synergistaceae bacterium]|nr:16S rRNA (guanine(527)-N(7))-methyltransferase RsmG [Synergistota bacterium]NLM70507.1 16S rRNA (guanine(527)-N(7))-methyltransferase RsmG [Synergistaceae bacterium]